MDGAPVDSPSAYGDVSDPLASSSSPNIKAISLQTLASGLDANPLDIPSYLSSILLPTSAPSGSDLAQLDNSLNELLTRLTLLSQDTSSALEQSISDISRTVPRLNYDLQFMRESAGTLQTSLNTVQGKVRRVDSRSRRNSKGDAVVPTSATLDGSTTASTSAAAPTTRSLEKLVHLDKLKIRMESARDILREAESWSTLEAEITASISSAEWEKAGSRLAEAGRSMVVFQSTPAEYESRKALLVSLQNGLETALSSALGTALDGGDTEGCARFYAVFEGMGRSAEFRSYYYTKRRARILDAWAEYDGEDFAAFLPRFYTLLGQALDRETGQVERVFPPGKGKEVLAAFLQSTLEALSPSLQSRLASMADLLGATALPELIKTYKATEEVALAIHSIVGRMTSQPPSPITPTTPVRPTPRKRDTSQSQSLQTPHRLSSFTFESSTDRAMDGTSSAESAWETTLFEPFLQLQTAYGALERRYLLHLLRSDTLHPASSKSSSSSSNPNSSANALSDRSLSIFHLAGDAIGRCLAFTHGYAAPGLLSALSDFLAAFFEGSHAVLNVQPTPTPDADELDFGLDYSTEDWTAFQAGLQVLKVCRDMATRLEGFEERLGAALANALGTGTPGSSPAAPNATSAGAMTLLRQSTLNSAELEQLIANPAPASRGLGCGLVLPAEQALADLTSAAQVSLSNIILTPLRSALSSYPSLPIWAQPQRSARRDGLSIPTFSLSPTDTIARVAEGLLNLLRVFEVYAQDPALAHSLATLPYISSSALPLPPADPGAGPGAGAAAYPAELVLSTWISSLALSLLSHLTHQVLPAIQKLTVPGANQLAADLGYLGNAVRALDVEWADLERWREGAEVDEEAWKARSQLENEEGREVWARIGRARGWVA